MVEVSEKMVVDELDACGFGGDGWCWGCDGCVGGDCRTWLCLCVCGWFLLSCLWEAFVFEVEMFVNEMVEAMEMITHGHTNACGRGNLIFWSLPDMGALVLVTLWGGWAGGGCDWGGCCWVNISVICVIRGAVKSVSPSVLICEQDVKINVTENMWKQLRRLSAYYLVTV